MIQFHVTLPESSYLPAAQRTDPPLYNVKRRKKQAKYKEKRSLVKQNRPDVSSFHPKKTPQNRPCYLKKITLMTLLPRYVRLLPIADLKWTLLIAYNMFPGCSDMLQPAGVQLRALRLSHLQEQPGWWRRPETAPPSGLMFHQQCERIWTFLRYFEDEFGGPLVRWTLILP